MLILYILFMSRIGPVDYFWHRIWPLVFIIVCIKLLLAADFIIDEFVLEIYWVSFKLLSVIIHLFNWSSKVYFISYIILDIYIISFIRRFKSCLISSLWYCSKSAVIIRTPRRDIMATIHQTIHFVCISLFILLNLSNFGRSSGRRLLLLESWIRLFESWFFLWLRIIWFYFPIKR